MLPAPSPSTSTHPPRPTGIGPRSPGARREKTKITTLRVNETDFTVVLHGFAGGRCWVEVQTPEEFRGWRSAEYKKKSGQVAILQCQDELTKRVKEKLLEDMIETEFEKI